MRARAAAGSATAVIALALACACGPIAGNPPLPAPINSCPEHDCSLYKPFVADGPAARCGSGTCDVAARVDYTLVVSVPDTSYFAPAQTFVIPSTQLFARPPTTTCRVGVCAFLPGLGVVNGQYRPLRSAQNQVSYFIGDVAALPVHVAYRPLLLGPPPSMTKPPPTNEATSVGFPLLPSIADRVSPLDGIAGPLGGPNPGFHALLPPGSYERTVMPDPPFDAFFPPDVGTVSVTTGVQSVATGTDVLNSVDTTAGMIGGSREHPTFKIVRADEAPLDGWTAHLRDQTTFRRLSTHVTLGDANRMMMTPPTYRVELNTNHHPASGDALTNTDLLVVPPAGVDATPTLVAPFLAGTLAVPTYPLIPPPATVKGSVTITTGGAPASAELLFRSKKIYLTTSDPSFTTNLFYETHATAVAATDGADARYSVRLPRGEYDVIVVPSDGSAAKSVLGLIVVTDLDTQDGKNFALRPKRFVRGVARVSDGRALAGAVVIATPAASLAASGVPSERWPRLAITTTELDGTFVFTLDSGPIFDSGTIYDTYDITVRPADGSRLPWVVSPSRSVPIGDADLLLTDPIEIPAPIAAGLTLVDPQENPIVRAIVRAYAVPSGGTAFVEIGRALTDTGGRYELFLAGTPHP